MPIPQTVEVHHHSAEVEYVNWNMAEQELRAFLLATARGMAPWFEERKVEAEKIFDRINPEEAYGDEGYSAFMDDVGIFWDQYWQQMAAVTIKEAFKLFEVFLEASAQHILRRYHSGLVDFSTDNSWNFNDCARFYKDYLSVEVLPRNISNIKWIRDKLSHLEDIRTPTGIAQLESHMSDLALDISPTEEEIELGLYHDDWTPYMGTRLNFTPVQTWRVLQILRSHTNQLAKTFHTFCWPGPSEQTTQELWSLMHGIAVNPRLSSKKPGDSRYLVIPTPS